MLCSNAKLCAVYWPHAARRTGQRSKSNKQMMDSVERLELSSVKQYTDRERELRLEDIRRHDFLSYGCRLIVVTKRQDTRTRLVQRFRNEMTRSTSHHPPPAYPFPPHPQRLLPPIFTLLLVLGGSAGHTSAGAGNSQEQPEAACIQDIACLLALPCSLALLACLPCIACLLLALHCLLC